MAAHKLLNNFTGGEITPHLSARIDLQKYDTSCRQMENMRPLPWGGARFRSGTVYCGITQGALPARLMPFVYSETTSYLIEFTPGKLHFWNSDGSQIMSGGSPLEISTPYLAAHLWQVQGRQINDVMYLTHPSYPVYKLTRVSATNFTCAEVAWKYPALLDENIDTTKKLQVGALSGSTTLTATGHSPFTADHVGSYWELRHLKAASSTTVDLSGSSGTLTGTALEVVGDWTVTTAERWYGTLQVQRSVDGGSTWVTCREITSKSNHNVSESGSELAPAVGQPRVQLRLVYTASGDPYGTSVWTGTAPTSYVKATAILEAANAYVSGFVKVTGYTSATQVTVDVKLAPASTLATSTWSEGAWSAAQGYPRTVGFFEQRLFFAGTTKKPNTTWGSVTADFENFQYSDLDDAAVSYQAASSQQNPIQWLAPLTGLNAGTAGNEIAIRSGNGDEPLTPSNVTIRGKTNYGSQYVQALQIGSAILFVQRQGLRIRELKESSYYAPPGEDNTQDLTLLAEHITGPGIVQMDFAYLPDPTVYVVRTDGVLAVMTYNREQNIIAWARWKTYGDGIVSVACLPGNVSDKVFVCVKRGQNVLGTDQYCVEGFTTELQDKVNGVFLDSAYQWNDGSAHTVFNMGNAHFHALPVSVVADGQALAASDYSWNVNEGGFTSQLTLVRPATVVTVGLPYSGILQPMPVDMAIANGTTQGRKRKISEVVIRFKDTLGCTYGNSTVNDPANGLYAAELPFRSTSDNMDSSPPLFTGDKQVLPWEGGNDLNGDIVISQQQPLPMTVLGLFAKIEVFGE